jgi:hypothetical protein
MMEFEEMIQVGDGGRVIGGADALALNARGHPCQAAPLLCRGLPRNSIAGVAPTDHSPSLNPDHFVIRLHGCAWPGRAGTGKTLRHSVAWLLLPLRSIRRERPGKVAPARWSTRLSAGRACPATRPCYNV